MAPMPLTTTSRRAAALTTSLVLALGGAFATAAPASADKPNGGHCARQSKIAVPGAQAQKVACLDDLTTAGTVASGHTNPNDWAGLNAAGTRNPSGVPGIQVDGYFPDTSTTNANNGWKHDSQFVIRIPDHWNGGLVVSGAPGVRGQYANDFIIGDWVLAKGYAFASTDKGNTGASFYDDGSAPGRVDRRVELARDAADRGHEAGGQAGPRQGAARVRTCSGSPTVATSRGGSWRTALTSTTAASTGRAPCSGRRGPTCSPTSDGAEELPGVCRDGGPGGPRRDHRGGLRAGVRVPVAVPPHGVLGPDAADLPRGARPDLRRRPQGRDPVLCQRNSVL